MQNILKAAIVGLGNIAPMHIKSLNAINIKIEAVCDKNLDKVNQIATELNCKGYSSYEEMLQNSGFDVLHICLPHYLHAPVAIEALNKGFNVLTEKPLATSIADAEEMISVATKNKKALGVIFQNRYSPGVQLIKETLSSGELGAIKGGWLRVNWYRKEDYYTQSDWRGKWETEGGGVVINQAIHSFDLLNYFLGNPASVHASIANRAHPSIEVEDISEGVIVYNSTPISFFVNTFHPYDEPATIELVCEYGKASLIGENATINYNEKLKKTAGADIEAQRIFGMKSYWGVSHIKQISAFYEALHENKLIDVDGIQGVRTQILINSIYKSAKEGCLVKL